MSAKKHTYDTNRLELWKQLPLRTPYHIALEPTFLCNFRCNYCIHAMSADEIKRRTYRFEDMPWETFERIVDSICEFDDSIKQVVFSGMGEPLVNKRLPEMVRRIKQTGRVERTLLITNGSLLTHETGEALVDAGLDICKISLQGISAESYKNICGVDIDWDEFYDNIVYFSQHKRNCLLKVKTADTSVSSKEEEQFYEKFNPICDYTDVEHIYPQFDGVDYSESVLEDAGKNRFWHPLKRLRVCSTMFYKMYVLQDGRVCLAYPDGMTFEGFNINEMSLREMWNSDEVNDMWIRALNHALSACDKCLRWSYSAHPEDILDGHEAQILSRLKDRDISQSSLRKQVVLCYDTTQPKDWT